MALLDSFNISKPERGRSRSQQHYEGGRRGAKCIEEVLMTIPTISIPNYVTPNMYFAAWVRVRSDVVAHNVIVAIVVIALQTSYLDVRL